jgi:hypothetical protein
MLRKPTWTSTAILASLVAVCVSPPSHAATDACLSAPNGVAPKGQHWYYHLVRATQQKCWYLHETLARPAANAAPSARAGKSTRPAAPVETVRSAGGAASSPPQRYASAQPSGASSVDSNTSRTDEATAAITASASAPANTKTAAPLQPAREPTAAPSTTTIWPDPPPASVGVQETNAAWGGVGAPALVSNTSDTRATTNQEVVAQHSAKPVTATAPDNPSTNTVAQDLLIIALASALAAAVSVAFAVLRRRKFATAKLADFVALAAAPAVTVSAYFAALHRRKLAKAIPAGFFPRFDSKSGRQSLGWSILQGRKAKSPQSATIQTSLVPEQLTMQRPFVAPRWQERVKRDRRAHAEWRAPDSDT